MKKEIDKCVIEKGQQTEKIINRKNTKKNKCITAYPNTKI